MPKACGPSFPNNLLDQGDEAVLVAPVTGFEAELARMRLATSRFQALPPEGNNQRSSYAAQAAAAEANDLAAALKKAKASEEVRESARKSQAAVRDRLSKYLAEVEAWEDTRPWTFDDNGSHRGEPEKPKPVLPAIEISAALPSEFQLYLKGFVDWSSGGKEAARASWEALLNLPPGERHWKSTWAAFMLGKAWADSDADAAIKYFKQVRTLARAGFVDSTGLAAASLGFEAKVYLKQENYRLALQLYLEQLATGDGTAAVSLRLVCQAAIQSGSLNLASLANDPQARKVVTAFLISSKAVQVDSPGKTTTLGFWLEAIEAADVKDVDSADQIALAAYQAGNMEQSQRWLDRARHSVISDWLQAKLLLRAGKVDQATALLSKVCYRFPVVEPENDLPESEHQFQDHVYVDDNDTWAESITAARHALGELGVLQLARHEYAQSLDALLRAGFWGDAAYVAERVLSLDELKNYVDQNWPAENSPPAPAKPASEGVAQAPASVTSPSLLRKEIRYLLARRLMRGIRGDEARAYYPEEWLPRFDQLCDFLRTGWDTSVATNQRAESLFAAAMVVRTNGMELLGTEVQPDWHIHEGSFEYGVTWEERQTNTIGAKFLKATQEELRRASQHQADPEQRFHYRYQAAFLAWEAAKYMPNNSDETARVLCTAGSWLKGRDSDTADIFYKALVRRNRLTAVGAEADRRRWFPDIDANGNLMIFSTQTVNETVDGSATAGEAATETSTTESSEPLPIAGDPTEQTSESVTVVTSEESGPGENKTTDTPSRAEAGDEYTVQPGDTLTAIVRRYAQEGYPTTVEDIVAANPGLRPNAILIGQRIVVPVSTASLEN
jgi:LysM repeat protein